MYEHTATTDSGKNRQNKADGLSRSAEKECCCQRGGAPDKERIKLIDAREAGLRADFKWLITRPAPRDRGRTASALWSAPTCLSIPATAVFGVGAWLAQMFR